MKKIAINSTRGQNIIMEGKIHTVIFMAPANTSYLQTGVKELEKLP